MSRTMEGRPRILLLDIETIPNLVTSWGLKVDGYLSHDNIITERHIICASWKWLGESKVYSSSVLSDPGAKESPDVGILFHIKRVWNESDAVVAHNGDQFDIPWVMARLAILDFSPIKPLIQIDTKVIAKKKFFFNSNRLDYLGKVLGLGGKIKTEFDLWLDCMKGNKKAIKKMVTYNREDVRLLERVFLRLRPFVPSKINHALYAVNDSTAGRTCPTCGEDALESRGYSYTRATKRRNMHCLECGAWSYRPMTARGVPR